MNNKNGRNIFYTLFVLNVIADVVQRIFPVFYFDARLHIPQILVSIGVSFFLFYGIYKGYNWLKYILIIMVFSGFIICIKNAGDIYLTKTVYYDSREITANSVLADVTAYVQFIISLIYLSTALLFLFSKNMKDFLISSRKERSGMAVNTIENFPDRRSMMEKSKSILLGIMMIPLFILWSFGAFIGAVINATNNNILGVVLSIFIPGYGAIITVIALLKWLF